jgi:hypothetical protein
VNAHDGSAIEHPSEACRDSNARSMLVGGREYVERFVSPPKGLASAAGMINNGAPIS